MAMQEQAVFDPGWHFGDRVRKARRDPLMGERMNQQQLATLVGVPVQVVAAWESGINRPRDIVGVSQKIAEVTGYPAEWILGITQPPWRPRQDSNLRPEVLLGELVSSAA